MAIRELLDILSMICPSCPYKRLFGQDVGRTFMVRRRSEGVDYPVKGPTIF